MKTFKEFLLLKEQKIFGIVPHNVGAWDHDYGGEGGHVTNHPIEHTIGNENKDEFLNHSQNKEYIDHMARNYASGHNTPPPVSGTPYPGNPKIMSIIDGNHRHHAAKKAGMSHIPVEHVPHEDVRLLHPDYKPHDDVEETISQGHPLTDFKEKDGSYDMKKPRKELGGLTLGHYFKSPSKQEN